VLDGFSADRGDTMNCPDPKNHYQTDVNKGDLNMRSWQGNLNEQYERGYVLAHVFEQGGNTVLVYAHHNHQ
jgi:hypothetical protein